MNETDIRKYANLMKELNLSGLEVDESRGIVRLERTAAPEVQMAAAAEVSSVPSEPAVLADESITSPTVGVFYSSPAEDAEPFVKVGDVVHKGDVVCIIEAMKLMNEITAEKDCVIVEVCAENGQIVEYGTELFRIKEREE